MAELLQHLVNGLVLGGTYALLGIGLTLIFGLMNVVNFAHGEFYTLGAYAAFAALAGLGAGFFPALGLAIAAGAAPRALCEGALLRPLRVFVLLVAGALIAASWVLIQKTTLGRAMRATFQDRDTAALMGVRIDRIHTATFAFGSALAAAAGALLGPVFLAYPSMGDLAALKAFSVVILGGLGNLPGAALGGLLLGIAEELGAGYVSSGYRDAVGFVIIILVLLFRPSGLFARAERVG